MPSKLEKQGNKWTFRYYDDGKQKRKTIEAFSFKEAQKLQLDFLSSMGSGNVEFAKNDMLYVEIRREQFYIENKKMLKTENYIEKVLKHNKHKQMNLPI